MIILITGGNSGIGRVLAQRLERDGHELIFILRNRERRLDFLQRPAAIYYADLADPVATREVVASIAQDYEKIDLLFNNAGILLDQSVRPHADLDVHFAVNTLAPYLLLRTLESRLRSGTVINTSSGAAAAVKQFWSNEELARPQTFSKFTGPYAQSKLALSYWTYLLGDSLAARGTQLFSVDPGGNDTKMTRGAGTPWLFRVLLRPLIFKSPDRGANLLYRTAFEPPQPVNNGAFLVRHHPKPLSVFQQAPERGTALLNFLDSFL